MSDIRELKLNVKIKENAMEEGALEILKTLRPDWSPKDVRFMVSCHCNFADI